MVYLQHNLQDAINCGAPSLDQFNQSMKATFPLFGTLRSNLFNKHSLWIYNFTIVMKWFKIFWINVKRKIQSCWEAFSEINCNRDIISGNSSTAELKIVFQCSVADSSGFKCTWEIIYFYLSIYIVTMVVDFDFKCSFFCFDVVPNLC